MMSFNLVSFYFNVILVPRIPNPETRIKYNISPYIINKKKLWTNFSKNCLF